MTEIKRVPLIRRRTFDDREARLRVEKSILGHGHIVIDGFNPAETGYGDRMCLPVTDKMREELDVGCFMELTRDQAIDLHVKLANALFAEDQEGQ
jgi:hypothetical protein